MKPISIIWAAVHDAHRCPNYLIRMPPRAQERQKVREAADFDAQRPWHGTSPLGRRSAWCSFRLATLISIGFVGHSLIRCSAIAWPAPVPAWQSARAAVQPITLPA